MKVRFFVDLYLDCLRKVVVLVVGLQVQIFLLDFIVQISLFWLVIRLVQKEKFFCGMMVIRIVVLVFGLIWYKCLFVEMFQSCLFGVQVIFVKLIEGGEMVVRKFILQVLMFIEYRFWFLVMMVKFCVWVMIGCRNMYSFIRKVWNWFGVELEFII